MLTLPVVSALVVAVGGLQVAPRATNVTKAPSFSKVLADVGTKFRTEAYRGNFRVSVDAYARQRGVAPDWSLDVLTCANSIKSGVERLKREYGPAHAISVFEQACEYSAVYLDLGGDKAACSTLLVSLREEYQGEQNYHRWCRKAATAESESMQAALKMLESDAEAKKLMAKCEEKCPSIAKMIETGAAIDVHWMKMFEPPPAEQTWEQWKETYQKELNELDVLHNSMCDHRTTAKCTLGSMSQSCGKMLQKIRLPKALLGHMFDYCDKKAPCAKACNGVTEKCHSFMDKEMWAFWGGDKEKLEMCDALPAVEECAAKRECEKFMEFTGFAPKTLKKPRQMCDIVQSPCYKRINTACNTTRVAFYGPAFNASAPPAPKPDTCARKLGMPSGKDNNATSAECCPKFSELGKCAASIGCTSIFKGIVKNTPSYWYPYGDGIKDKCSSAWHGVFDA